MRKFDKELSQWRLRHQYNPKRRVIVSITINQRQCNRHKTCIYLCVIQPTLTCSPTHDQPKQTRRSICAVKSALLRTQVFKKRENRSKGASNPAAQRQKTNEMLMQDSTFIKGLKPVTTLMPGVLYNRAHRLQMSNLKCAFSMPCNGGNGEKHQWSQPHRYPYQLRRHRLGGKEGKHPEYIFLSGLRQCRCCCSPWAA